MASRTILMTWIFFGPASSSVRSPVRGAEGARYGGEAVVRDRIIVASQQAAKKAHGPILGADVRAGRLEPIKRKSAG